MPDEKIRKGGENPSQPTNWEIQEGDDFYPEEDKYHKTTETLVSSRIGDNPSGYHKKTETFARPQVVEEVEESSSNQKQSKLSQEILNRYDFEIIQASKNIRRYIRNRLVIESDHSDVRIRIKALELLGRLSDIGSFENHLQWIDENGGETLAQVDAELKTILSKYIDDNPNKAVLPQLTSSEE